MPPDGRRKKQALAGGLPSASFVFRLLELRSSKAHEPHHDGHCAYDSPLHDRHMLHAVADTAGDLGEEVGDELHGLVFKYTRWDMTELVFY